MPETKVTTNIIKREEALVEKNQKNVGAQDGFNLSTQTILSTFSREGIPTVLSGTNTAKLNQDFWGALEENEYGKAEILLDRGADIDSRQVRRWGSALIHVLVSFPVDWFKAQWLIHHGANPNQKIEGKWNVCASDVDFPPLREGATPLHIINYRKFTDAKDTMDLLLQKGANINAMDCYGETALHWAMHYNLTELEQMIFYFKKNNARVDIKSIGMRENTPLLIASSKKVPLSEKSKELLSYMNSEEEIRTLSVHYKKIIAELLAKLKRYHHKSGGAILKKHY